MQKQLGLLRRHFLPSRLDPTLVYSPRELDRARAYRVLAHAEMEAYLEERATSIVRQALAEWKKSGFVSRTVAALLAFSGRPMELPPESLTAPKPNQVKDWPDKVYLTRKIDSAARSFFYTLEHNHGVKEENILGLMLPIGVPHDSLDPVWLAAMNSFGETRGEAAHSSPLSPSVKYVPHPVDELSTVNQLVPGFIGLDEHINMLGTH